jgi:hypothetical protein
MDDDERMAILDKETIESSSNSRKRSKKSTRDKDKKSKVSKTDEYVKKMKQEMEAMKKKLEELEQNSKTETTNALGFDAKTYLEMGFIESAKWISNTVAVNMREKLKTCDIKWNALRMMPNHEIGTPCATFNRGEACGQGLWHTAPNKKHISNRIMEPLRNVKQSSREELRIHCCTLCIKGLGIMINHPILQCPWILESNWTEKGSSTASSSSSASATASSSKMK